MISKKLILFFSTLVLAGFAHAKPAYNVERLTQSLILAKKHWAEAKPQSYEFVFSWSCFCAPEFTSPKLILVTDDKITQILDVATHEPIGPEQYQYYKTIDGLLAEIEDALFIRKAYFMNVSFDGDLGAPTKAYIDYVAAMADDELSFSIYSIH